MKIPFPINVLLVDDNPLISQLLTDFLTSKGLSCSSLTEGTKLEAWLTLNKCDAVIMDIDMPDIDGLSLISKTRTHHPNPHISSVD